VRGALRAAAGLLAAAVLLASPSAARAAATVAWQPADLRPGDVAWVHVRGIPGSATVEGSAAGASLLFFPYAGGHAALLGVDLDARAGAHPWRLAIQEPGRKPYAVAGQLHLQARTFQVQRLTLPPGMVDLAVATERRARAEGEYLRTLYRNVTAERLWRGRFTRPVAGEGPGTGFGARRVINGKPRAAHSGIDFAAPAGTPVVAANAGRVALVADYFFPGRLVVIDHGLGLHTLYFHLETTGVADGDRVERGQPIGTVGATGRATGPHLHFGAQLGPARIDPAALLALPLE
jgi:murein DD-endopeptidase MepM/ murein hydrolase activator NlpD